MSNVSKGKTYEKEVENIYIARGYAVERAFNKTVWLAPGRPISIAHDFFGLFDIIAKIPGQPTRWIQVTTWESVAPRRAKLLRANWASAYDCPIIYAKYRAERPAPYRLLYGKDNYEWKGEIEWAIKK